MLIASEHWERLCAALFHRVFAASGLPAAVLFALVLLGLAFALLLLFRRPGRAVLLAWVFSVLLVGAPYWQAYLRQRSSGDEAIGWWLDMLALGLAILVSFLIVVALMLASLTDRLDRDGSVRAENERFRPAPTARQRRVSWLTRDFEANAKLVQTAAVARFVQEAAASPFGANR